VEITAATIETLLIQTALRDDIIITQFRNQSSVEDISYAANPFRC
jgi:hypothetical protein